MIVAEASRKQHPATFFSYSSAEPGAKECGYEYTFFPIYPPFLYFTRIAKK